MKPRIIIDRNIPFIEGMLESVADVTYLAAAEITNSSVRSADCLIVRTRTRCDAALLDGTDIRLIVTATIGYDHIDTAYCAAHNITWRNAPGCNAASVQQYVGAAIAEWAAAQGTALQGKTVGIIGVGHVGSKVEALCAMLGMNVLRNDPPRAEREGNALFSTLDEIAEQADIITLHTPLTRGGNYPTFHMIDNGFFSKLKRKPLIINAARGGIVDEEALMQAMDENLVGGCVIDCWEHEPDISPALLQRAFIATPHIAGYSADGKANATLMSLKTVNSIFSLGLDLSHFAPLPPKRQIYINGDEALDVLRSSYDILRDSRLLKAAPARFEHFRSHYPIRRECGITVLP